MHTKVINLKKQMQQIETKIGKLQYRMKQLQKQIDTLEANRNVRAISETKSLLFDISNIQPSSKISDSGSGDGLW